MPTYSLNTRGGLLDTNRLPMKAHSHRRADVHQIERYLDMETLVREGYVQANNDVFNLLVIPARYSILQAGAEVMVPFDGTSPTVDIDFEAGDDIIDGASVATAGFLAGGVNGQAGVITPGTGSTFEAVSTQDRTIDVKLINAAADVTTGVLRVWAICMDQTHVTRYGGLVSRDTQA